MGRGVVVVACNSFYNHTSFHACDQGSSKIISANCKGHEQADVFQRLPGSKVWSIS